MEQLKRHWEKILLTMALLALLAAAGALLLKIGALSEEVREIQAGIRGGGQPIPELSADPYNRAHDRLLEPVLWAEMPVDPFQPTQAAPPPDNGRGTGDGPTPPPPPPTTCTITLLQVRQEPFTMIFLAYIGQGRNFQLNMQFRPRTFFIEKIGDPVRDQFNNTGYVVTNFVQKSTKRKDPRFGDVEREIDVAELTVQRPGEKPVVLVLGQPAVHGEPVAVVACQCPDRTVLTTTVRRGQYFRCGLTTYNVVDIKAERMVIVDAQTPEEKPIEIKVRSATPVKEEEGADPWPMDLENLK